MANLPWYGTAFNVTVHLFTTAGLVTNPGTLTCKISKDYGDYADCHGTGPTEEDSTYGQIKVALDATDMTATHIDGVLVDDTAGCLHGLFHIDTIPLTRGLAGTALPDAAADAAGGLPISDAGGLDLDTYIKRLEAAFTATIAGRIDAAISTRSSHDAAAVWTAVSRTLTAFGFEVTATVDEEALAAAIVAAIVAEGIEADVDETAIALAITTALGSLSVTVASPVGSGGTITIHAGDDYLDAEGRSIAFTIADATHTYLLDDGTAAVKFKSAQATWTATDITSTAGGYIVKFEPTDAQTAAVTYKQGYEVEATLTSTSVVTLCTGNLVVVRDIPAT